MPTLRAKLHLTNIDIDLNAPPVQFDAARWFSDHPSAAELRENCFLVVHWAVKSKQLEALRLLLQYGADPNAPSKSGGTALHRAVASHQPAALRLLLEHGGDPNRASNSGRTVMHCAALWKNGSSAGGSDMLRLLKQYGGDPKRRTGKPRGGRWARPIDIEFWTQEEDAALSPSRQSCVERMLPAAPASSHVCNCNVCNSDGDFSVGEKVEAKYSNGEWYDWMQW